jgi:uncharacterized NAD(P)/FAD-binding protein YdhS
MRQPVIVVCGSGASATALLQALAAGSTPFTVFVIGMGEPGEGLAYATRNSSHLLNIPAQRMSIDPEEPDQFVLWLEKRNIWTDDWPSQFVPRSHYGQYLREAAALAKTAPHLDTHFLREQVVSLTRKNAGWRVAHSFGQTDADFVVLATGNDMPSPLAARLDPAVKGLVVDNPWELPPINPEERVLILGTGLTAIDTVLSLSDKGHRGEISMLSRHGLLPQTHSQPQPQSALLEPFPKTALGILHALRLAVGPSPEAERWQGVMDAMRPHWPQLWQQMPLAEQRRFLRHGATIWNMHRHRVAPQVARRLHAVLTSNGRILKGRLGTVMSAQDGGLLINICGGRSETRLTVDRIINCLGPNSDPEKTHNRLIENMVASLQVRTAPSGIGLDVTDDNRVLGHDGLAHASLFAMGALTRGHWWEITALPEIVRQAQGIARSLQLRANADSEIPREAVE